MPARLVARIRRQGLADHAIADHAGRQGGMQIEDVAGHAALQHEAGIGHAGRVLGNRRHIRLGQSPIGAVLDMQAHLHIKDPGDRGARRPHVLERVGLVDRKPVGAGKMHQKQVIPGPGSGETPAPAGCRRRDRARRHDWCSRSIRQRRRCRAGPSNCAAAPVPWSRRSRQKFSPVSGNRTTSPSSASVSVIWQPSREVSVKP